MLKKKGRNCKQKNINEKFSSYGFGNKVVTCAHAEDNYEEFQIVFLDSDTLILNEPNELIAEKNSTVKVRPVEKKLIGTNGNDENSEYWEEIYSWANINKANFVRTSVTRERILPYWNAGLVTASSESGFFNRWLKIMEKMIEKDLQYPEGKVFTDQIALSIATQVRELRVNILPKEYNFPIDKLDKIKGKKDNINIDPIVVHYHNMFDYFPISNPLDNVGISTKCTKKIDKLLRDSGIIGFKNWFRYRINNRISIDALQPKVMP